MKIDAIQGFWSIHICYPEMKSCDGFTDKLKVTRYTTFKVYDNASDNSVKYYANECMNGQKRYGYAIIEFVSDDGTIATCPAMTLGFVRYNITLGIPTLHFTDEEELSFNTIQVQENMAVDNSLYAVVHTASDYVSSEQLEKEFVSSFILGDVMNCVYIVTVEAIHGPLFVFNIYGSFGDTKLFCVLPQRRWGQYFSNKIQS